MFVCLWLVIQSKAIWLEYMALAKLRFHGVVLSQKLLPWYINMFVL